MSGSSLQRKALLTRFPLPLNAAPPRRVSHGVPLLLASTLLCFPGPTWSQVPVGEWEVAGPYPLEQVDRSGYPNFYAVFLAPWQSVTADSAGVVDLGGQLPKEYPAGDLAIARRVFASPEDRVVNLTLAFSGEADLFLNGSKLFEGRRGNPGGSGTAGIPGGHWEEITRPEVIALRVKAGLNEIFLMVSAGEGAWGFKAEVAELLEPKAEDHEATAELWRTEDLFLTSESVLKDPIREILYVTSFDNQYGQRTGPSGFISTLSMEGEILDLKWVEGLHAPTGMDIRNDTLFVCEREHLLAIELASGEVANRWAIPDPVFPNDLVIDDEGAVYISDTRTGDWADSRIYRFRDGKFDIFANEGINRANGLWIHQGWLLVGSSGDGYLKRVELSTGRVEKIISLGWGVIDGIRVDREGNYLVSHWEGQLYRISPQGKVLEILDAQPEGWNTADFEYLPQEGIVLMPTFLDNRVRAIRIKG